MKNLIFLCVASAVFILSVIVLNYAPTITGLVGKGKYDQNGNVIYSYGWADFPCRYYSDIYNELEDKPESDWGKNENKQIHLDLLKEGKNDCLRKKAMIGLEYSAFNLDVIFGFVCAILGILLYSGNKVGKIAGLIGLGGGAIGFVLTLVYVIYSGIVFNNDVIGKKFHHDDFLSDLNINPYTGNPTLESDGAFMEWKDSANTYVCIFYDKDNKDKLYQKYSDYGNKYLNYYYYSKKDESADYYKYTICTSSSVDWETCKNYDEGTGRFQRRSIYNDKTEKIGECDKIYVTGSSTDEKKNLYNSWVTTIVFGCFIFVLDAVLAVFGFLVYKDSSGTSGAI